MADTIGVVIRKHHDGRRKVCPALILTILALMLWALSCNAEETGRTEKLYPFCVEVGVPGTGARPLSGQASLFRELGFTGTGHELWAADRLEENLKILDQAGLKLFMVWTPVNVNTNQGPAYSPDLPGSIRKLKGRPVTVCVLLQGLKPADPAGMSPAVIALRELGKAAAEAGVRISIYHHLNDWAEALPFTLEVVKQVNHPQVGFNFNLCHWLKVEGKKDYRPLLRDQAGKLFCVLINGATVGAETWTHGLIRPLDEGDFDNRQLLATLGEMGYRGPVGLMCYGIPGDPRDYLSRSLKTWRQWQVDPAPSK